MLVLKKIYLHTSKTEKEENGTILSLVSIYMLYATFALSENDHA